MLIPHLESLNVEALKDPKITLEMLLDELRDQGNAGGSNYTQATIMAESEGETQFVKWLKFRVDESEKIFQAVKAEILRRFQVLEGVSDNKSVHMEAFSFRIEPEM